MTIDTAIFVRIIAEHRQAGENAVERTMCETVRFGCLPAGHINSCARERYNEELTKLRAFPFALPL